MIEPLIIDSFAGGGGASTGIEMALGRSPDIAINHNPAALALHEVNHPDTLHLSENVYKVDPLDYLRRKHIGLAWFSPDCKHFSKAKGGKPVERNVRDLAWIIPGWVERIQKSGGKVDIVILENVEEFQDWGPLVETDRGLMPNPDARGHTFQKWCKKLRGLGGRIEHRELRACDYGAPTIRKRLFVVVRFDGKKIVWPKPTHGKPDDPDVIAGRKLPWRTAAEIIDWSLPCPSIFDTSAEIMEQLGLRAVRPLADATMSRVARGIERYVLKAKRPFLVRTDMQSAAARNGVQDLAAPLNTVTTAGSFAVVAPSVIRFNTGATGHDAREPLATVTANSFKKRPGGAAPLGVVAPVLTYGQQGGANRSVEDPAHTITASKKDQNAVVVPTLIGCGGRAGQSRARSGDEPMATQTAKADVCIAAAFLAQNNYQEPGHDAREPVSTIVQKGSTQSVVAASLMSMKGSDRRDGPIDAPHRTVTAGGGKGGGTAVVAPHLMTMRNAGKPFNGADEPTHTITAGGAGISVVAPFMQKYYGTGDGARIDEPCHSVTTKDRFGFIEAEYGWPPFTEAQAARARQVADFMRGHGFWDEREFVTVDIAGEIFTIVDIGMRMLTPRELFSAQGFPPDYIIEFEFNGKPLPKSDQIACCGNSVSPPMAHALVAANCNSLVRYREAAE
ncbi:MULTISPECIES: DNA cytosine methyltransferase [unclassified Mesorhizobium]|uniref:DNA cytosine methyltransferase n=1 Tax=unclassified Mesorhizobium TaxID=325217 RepID=UPI001129AC0F|nr:MULTISPECIES: DNA cytosine methyltransferase [unclassified Mesorhizobium]TPK42284.1 C-5 cytosine-specific DNA methylase [Mesorhizobium sp. B2-5-2]TPL44521.1 C-5 cytosine-specific DNA methylase [Mesorhizobium sp. B2-4-5]TPM68708.1 C-5 cytosine-specific DNA methylase [Mesorhizobium sp. B2-1-6]TPN71732.1 C-5 cytosine-specific DNA methylase [Mesorhizobium sp. B1-1-2]